MKILKLMQQMTQETSMQFVDFSFLMPLYFFSENIWRNEKDYLPLQPNSNTLLIKVNDSYEDNNALQRRFG